MSLQVILGIMRPSDLLSTLFLLAGFLAGSFSVSADESVRADPTSLDFGQVTQGETVNTQFELVNSSSDSRLIVFMDFSISGLRAQVSPRIDAGGTVPVYVRLDTGNHTGKIVGNITLIFDDMEGTQVVVPITGVIKPSGDGPVD